MSNAKTIVITGASDGLGAAAAKLAAEAGHRVVVVGRSEQKTRAVASEIGIEDFHNADFTSVADVRKLANVLLESYERIDVLANNAGGLFSGPTMSLDGFEKTLQINHLSPVLLTNLLLERLLQCQALIVNTSSIGAKVFSRIQLNDLNTIGKYRPNLAYGNAKLANSLFARGLHSRYGTLGLTAISFHPGNVATSFASDTSSYFHWIYHSFLKRFLVTQEQGGINLYRFLDPANRERWVGSEYYGPSGRIARTHRSAYDESFVERHWEATRRMLGIDWP